MSHVGMSENNGSVKLAIFFGMCKEGRSGGQAPLGDELRADGKEGLTRRRSERKLKSTNIVDFDRLFVIFAEYLSFGPWK